MFIRYILILFLAQQNTFTLNTRRDDSDCRIEVDGILQYFGQHARSKFDRECLPWMQFEATYPKMIDENNFQYDQSIQAANNFCRNPNMSTFGPWCFVKDGQYSIAELCNVCRNLMIKPPLPVFSSTPAPPSSNISLQDVLLQFIDKYQIYFRDRLIDFLEFLKSKLQEFQEQVRE